MARYGYGSGGYHGGWAPYVPVAQRRRHAAKKMASLRKKGVDVQPIQIDGRKIAKSFWGEAWCEHLESFSDFENRLPRGRTYVRNGSVCHLAVTKGKINAKVSGSELYDVAISIKTLRPKIWRAIKTRCGGQIGSLLELLQGRLSHHVMEVVADRRDGLFPQPNEISLRCSCPDSATMCKHVAAVLYGVGARLDSQPEMLFLLRGVNHEELIAADAEEAVTAATSRGKSKRLATAALGDVFGIEIDTAGPDASYDGNPAAQEGDTSTPPKAVKSRAKITRGKATAPATGKATRGPKKTKMKSADSRAKKTRSKATASTGAKTKGPKKKSAKTRAKKADGKATASSSTQKKKRAKKSPKVTTKKKPAVKAKKKSTLSRKTGSGRSRK